MIIAIDFDGTIVANNYPKIGEVRYGAKDVINKLFNDGHYIIIWTCRTNQHLVDCAVWLAKNGFRFHQINESCPENMIEYCGDSRKVYADIYIDDRSVSGLPSWDEIYNIIAKRQKDKLLQIAFNETHLG
jgi:hypothetical protein